jgi:5-methylcytosine-specific restriction enzyme A
VNPNESALGARSICPGPFRTLDEAKKHGVVFDVPRRCCRWCGEPCKGRRSSFCSGNPTNYKRGHAMLPGSGCVHEWMLRSSAVYLRQAVFERDRGVCAACGANVPLLVAATKSMPVGPSWGGRERDEPLTREGVLGALGFVGQETWGMGAWHADHVIPVERGGGLCGLDGMQTLCAPCHRRKSAAERRQ